MTIKNAYFFFFFVFYELAERSDSLFPSDTVALITMQGIEMFLLLSIWIYYSLIFDVHTLTPMEAASAVMPILIIKIIIMDNPKIWKPYVRKFKEWPDAKKSDGKKIVYGAVVFIFLILVIGLTFMANKNGVSFW